MSKYSEEEKAAYRAEEDKVFLYYLFSYCILVIFVNCRQLFYVVFYCCFFKFY
jgi:hypothetical protein